MGFHIVTLVPRSRSNDYGLPCKKQMSCIAEFASGDGRWLRTGLAYSWCPMHLNIIHQKVMDDIVECPLYPLSTSGIRVYNVIYSDLGYFSPIIIHQAFRSVSIHLSSSSSNDIEA